MLNFDKIFSLMERIDPQYKQYNQTIFLIEDKRTNQARERSRNIITQYFGNNINQEYVEKILIDFENKFFHDPNLRKGSIMRLEPLFCKLALENGFQQENQNTQNIQILINIIRILYNMSTNGEIDLSKIDINTTTFEDLYNQFGIKIDELNQEKRKTINNLNLNQNSSYEIFGPIDFKTAHKIGNYSSPSGKICYTQDKDTWLSYTNNGLYNVYVALKKNWKNIKAEHDNIDFNAYDTYGLSMIFIIVDENGNLNTCNVRWNHDATFNKNRSVDYAMDEIEISKLLGVNFHSVFKPNNKWADALSNVLERLKNGEKPENVFEFCDYFKDGFAVVELLGKLNLIDVNNNFISKEWFDECSGFENGVCQITFYNKGDGFIDTKGNLIGNQLFDECKRFFKGLAEVFLRNKGYNWLKKDGTFLSPNLWFDFCTNFNVNGVYGISKVEKNSLYNFISINGEILNKQWFKICDEYINGMIKVSYNNKYNYTKNGKLVSDKWFDQTIVLNKDNMFACCFDINYSDDKPDIYILYDNGELKEYNPTNSQ